jgi:hypothetical protein
MIDLIIFLAICGVIGYFTFKKPKVKPVAVINPTSVIVESFFSSNNGLNIDLFVKVKFSDHDIEKLRKGEEITINANFTADESYPLELKGNGNVYFGNDFLSDINKLK